jgi:hypothetical protein
MSRLDRVYNIRKPLAYFGTDCMPRVWRLGARMAVYYV